VPISLVERVIADSLRLDVPEGAVIRRRDQPPWCGLVLRGVIRCAVMASDGREASKLYVRAGYLEGAELLADDPPPTRAPTRVVRREDTLSVEAVTDATVVALSVERLRPHVASEVRLAAAVMAQLGWTLKETIHLLQLMIFGTVRQRLAWRLLELASGDAGGLVAEPATQQSLAVAVGATREAVARAMAPWRRAGTIVVQRGRVVLRDPDRLAAEASIGG
jgi:CRP/FNR family transcriptional regulator